MKRKAVSVIMLILLLVSMLTFAFNVQPLKAEPTTIYVDDDNTGGPWDGTQGNPYQNITSALQHASVDDTIYVYNGTYREKVVIDTTLTLMGESRSNTIINGSGLSYNGSLVRIIADNVDISGFTVTNALNQGIEVEERQYCEVHDNIVCFTGDRGIVFGSATNNKAYDNVVYNSSAYGGIEAVWSSNNTIYNNVAYFNQWGIATNHGSYNRIYNNTVHSNRGAGIHIDWPSTGNMVYNNNVSSNINDGIRVIKQNETVISGNKISENDCGIFFSNSPNNTVSGNNITNNTYYGVYLSSSSNNTVSSNTITNSTRGVYLFSSSNDNTVSGNTITNNDYGVYLYWSSNSNIVSGNTITNNNDYGVWLSWLSNDNTVSGNNITNNAYGIILENSSNNSIYHNNFVDNTQQVFSGNSTSVWDHGYPSGGNYWSNYNGTDSYSGPNQDQPDSDGIGDTPYVIDGNNQDNYPFMGPWQAGATQIVSTESTGNSQYASLAVESDGTIHVAWHDYTNYADIFYKRFVPSSGWTITEVVSTNSTAGSYAPSLAVDSNGNIHIAWHDWTDYAGCGPDGDIFYKRYEVGSGWTITEVVSTNSTATSRYPSLAVDSNGNVHIAWTDYTNYTGSGTDLDIFYKRYEVGVGWTTTEVVSTNSTLLSESPSLAVDLAGNVHVAWRDKTNYSGGEIFYKRYEVGVGWTTTEVVSTESTAGSLNPSLAVDSNGNVHIAWTDLTNYAGAGTDFDIFYKRYEVGSGWTITEVVSTESTAYSMEPSLGVDLVGNVHVAWRDKTNYTGSGTDLDIFYKRYEVGSGWTITEVVSTESTANSHVPSLAVDLAGNVHVAWEDYTDYAGCGTDVDIFYKYLCVHSTQYPWSMFHHNPRHTGYTESPAPNTNKTMWTYPTDDWVESSPAVADGIVFIGSNDGNVYALDQDTGAKIWNYTTGWPVYSSPAVAYGKVYVAAFDHKVFCLDAVTGAHIWNHTTGGWMRSSPAVAYGKVYVGSDGGGVYCLNATTGAQIWNYPIGSWTYTSSPAVAGGRVYVGSSDDKVYCIDATTGAHIWNYTTDGDVRSSPAVADGKVYVESYDNKVYCIDATTGAHIWNYTTDGDVHSSPAVAYGKVYVGSTDGKVYCLDAATKAHIWNYSTGGAVYSSPAVADGMIYVGSFDNKTYCLNASTGVHIWNYTTGDHVYSSPAVADGIVFIGSNDGKVYAFGNVIRVPEDYPTVQQAIDAATPGATIIVAPGTYTENLIINKTVTIIGKTGSSTTFAGGGSGIAINIINTSHVTITNIEITDYDQGILIDNSSECQIYNNVMYLINDNGIVADGDNAANNLIYSNTISSNHIAIDVAESSTGNVIYGNTLSENEVGINVGHSIGNTIYWNSFVNNVYQVNMSNPSGNAWDNGYPSGGNYWSNYQGEDVDGDGIGDTPHIIDENNQDNYPLMKPYGGSYDIGIMDVTVSKTVVEQGQNVNIIVTILNYGIYTETRNIEIYANTTLIGFQSVTLTSRTPKNITFTWNTADAPRGNYTISATATTVPDETATADNTCIDGTISVIISGDIDDDGDIDFDDFILFAGPYGTDEGDPTFDPRCDFDGDGDIDFDDFIIFAGNYGKTI